jgi:hypothetical protein
VLDIERLYGQRKPLAMRIPLFIPDGKEEQHVRRTSGASSTGVSTPSFTEGDTATETEVETEVEDTLPARETNIHSPLIKISSKRRARPMTQHDLLNRYFRKDTIGLHNIDLLRLAPCQTPSSGAKITVTELLTANISSLSPMLWAILFSHPPYQTKLISFFTLFT